MPVKVSRIADMLGWHPVTIDNKHVGFAKHLAKGSSKLMYYGFIRNHKQKDPWVFDSREDLRRHLAGMLESNPEK